MSKLTHQAGIVALLGGLGVEIAFCSLSKDTGVLALILRRHDWKQSLDSL